MRARYMLERIPERLTTMDDSAQDLGSNTTGVVPSPPHEHVLQNVLLFRGLVVPSSTAL
jgi:hypothetical protein